MKLTVHLQLVLTPAQHATWLDTMLAFHAAASSAARVSFEAGVLNHYSIQRRCYRDTAESIT